MNRYMRSGGVLESQNFPSIVDTIAKGFEDYSRGKVSVPPIQTLGQPPLALWTAALKDKQNELHNSTHRRLTPKSLH